MDIYEVRRQILLYVVRNDQRFGESRGWQARFAKFIGMKPSYVSRIMSEPDAKDHKRIDTAVATRLEEALKLVDGTLLNPKLPGRNEAILTPHKRADEVGNSSPKPSLTSATITRARPLLSWAQVNLMLDSYDALQGVPGVQFVSSPADDDAGPNVKLVDMPDDSNAPRILEGDRLTFDPDLRHQARPGHIVLVRDKHGEQHIRMYKRAHPGAWQAAPLNSALYEPLYSDRDGLEVLAVAVARRENLLNGVTP
jgi:hypothetical protein